MSTQKKSVKVNQFGCPIGVAWTAKTLKERIAILKKGIESGRWKGAKLDLAKYHHRQYRSHLAAFLRDVRKSKKRKVKTNKRAA